VTAAVLATALAGPASAADPLAECKAFFEKFQKCVDGLKGDQQDEARIFMKTVRGTVGLSDDLNRGDPTMTSIMCGATMQEVKKEPMVQKYNCAW
jgi:hypothetical protein